MLWLRRFPLVAALPSFDSAETHTSLFAAFNSTMAASDCFTLLIFRFGLPPFFQRPCQHDSQGQVKPSQVPIAGVHACLSSLTTWSLSVPCHFGTTQCCLQPIAKPRHSKLYNFRCSITSPTCTTTDASLASSRMTAHGSWRRQLARPYLPSDFHRLPYNQLAWRSQF